MGTTAICPGTHKCASVVVDHTHLKHHYSTLENYLTHHSLTHHLPCEVTSDVSAGDGMLFNTDVMHRTGAHDASGEPTLVSVVFTFSESITALERAVGSSGNTRARTLPLGGEHMLRWDMWGHTLDDMSTCSSEDTPWRVWHSLGLLPHYSGGITPFTLWDELSLMFVGSRHRHTRVFVVGDFNAIDFSECVSSVVVLCGVCVLVYVVWKVYCVVRMGYIATLRARKMK
jgi:hypothetical protein